LAPATDEIAKGGKIMKKEKNMKVIKRVEIIDRRDEYLKDVLPEYYVGCVYPDNGDSFYVCSNIPSDCIAINIECKDGSFYAFFTDKELANGGVPGTVTKYYLVKEEIKK
jgi:hypothetical protein